jgi:hypothetical protein
MRTVRTARTDMILYYLMVRNEDEGFEDYYFSSMGDARRRATQVRREERERALQKIAEWRAEDMLEPGTRWQDLVRRAPVEIQRYTVADLPKKQLVLACLNQKGYVAQRKTVVKYADVGVHNDQDGEED